MLTHIEYPASVIDIKNWKLLTNQVVELYWCDDFKIDKRKQTVVINDEFEVSVINYPFDEVVRRIINKENKFYSHEIKYKFNVYPCKNCIGIGKVIFIDEITKRNIKIHSTNIIKKERGRGKVILAIDKDYSFLYKSPSKPIKGVENICKVCNGIGIHAIDKHMKIETLLGEILKG